MTTKQATGIALKFFAIYLLFHLLTMIPTIISVAYRPFEKSSDQPSTWSIFLIPAIGIIICLILIGLLWKTSTSLINKAGSANEHVTNDMTADGIMRIILSCMGLYLALQGIIEGLHVYASARSYARLSAEFHLDFNLLIVPMFKLVVGCTLIAKPIQWVKMIRSIGGK